MSAVSTKSKAISEATAKAEKRTKRVAITSAATMISSLQSFVTLAQSLDTDALGTSSSLKELATNISATNTLTLSFTSVQISVATTAVTQISVIIIQET